MDLSYYTLTTLYQDNEFALCRGRAVANFTALPSSVLVSILTSEHPLPAHLRMLEHEMALRDHLDSTRVLRPLGLARFQGHSALVLEDQQSEVLAQLLDQPAPGDDLSDRRPEPAMELGLFLRLAANFAEALGEVHRRGIIHKNIKPANTLVNQATGQVWLTGFGIASLLPRERQAPEAPETIAGTLAYMAPEQTGRMNRSIDRRSDLYALGVTFYQMLTGSLPFIATEPIEWLHCHIAREPMAPGERVASLPGTVSAIVLKLLAKTPEDRYQTASGLERDLRRCLAQWEAERRIDDFVLGEHDTPDRLLIPEKLYGRTREVETLLAAFDRVVHSGATELVLVSGYSGIGKSSIVHELQKVLIPPRALFAAGKFDQYKRDIPYSTIAQALQRLIRPLLTKSDDELGRWRRALHQSLGPNGQLMVDLVPDLKVVVGEQPVVPELPPQDAQRRFQFVFRRFLGVFARSEHPLVLFLDDLQWLDAATLDLLQDLVIQGDVRNLLLIGAYRENEVTAAHPLMRRLEAIRATDGASVQEITLAPLGRDDVCRLIQDSLCCDAGRAAPLAKLVHEKSAGNPFFGIQFLSALIDEELVTFDHAKTSWRWDLPRIRAKGYTDNVIDLLVGRLRRLPIDTQRALRHLACLGISIDTAVLGLVYEDSKQDLDHDLQRAQQSGLVLRSAGAYRFLHDRVQEAAYSLIPEAERADVHLRIGRLLAAKTQTDKREEAIFEIVNQLNRAIGLITSRAEKEQLAEFNLMAGKRAKASTAYVSALTYLVAGTSLLSDDGWECRPDLMFPLELCRAECEFLTGELASAETRLTMLSSRAVNPLERAAVTCLQSDAYTVLDRSDRAVEVCLDYLRHVGIEWSAHPTQEELRREYERTWALLGRRDIEELIDLPLMTDSEAQATMEVLTKAWTPATFSDTNLQCLVLWRMINLSLEFGNTEASCQAYALVFVSAGPHFGNHEAGRRFGQLGYDLVERRGFKRFQARTYMAYAVGVVSEVGPLRAAGDLFRQAFEAANTAGDLTFAAFSWLHLVAILRLAGEPLVGAQREAERGLEFANNARFGLAIDIISSQLAVIRTLRGLTATFGCFNDEQFDEAQMERRFTSDPRLAFPEWWYWTQKLQARFFAGDYESAVDASRNAQRLAGIPDTIETAEAHFYSALSHAAACGTASPTAYQRHIEELAEHHRRLQAYSGRQVATVQSRAELVKAEIARVEGRDLDAERLYEAAIQSARENEFVQNEALANELAARFYAARGFQMIAHAYLLNARYGYLRWGADGKVRQLDQLYPYVKSEERASVPTGTIGAPLEQLDLSTVIKMLRAVQGETDLEKLIATVMRLGLEHAAATRGLLILPHGDGYQIMAEATSTNERVTVDLRQAGIGVGDLPLSILQYVIRTRDSVLLQDAVASSEFAGDEYLRQHQERSVLCVPLLKQARLAGIIYLENNLTSGAFTRARIALLEVLASDAATSLENALLYRDLQEREREARLIVSSISGLVAALTPFGEVEAVNEQLLAYCGRPLEELKKWKMSDTIHPDDVPRTIERIAHSMQSGEPYEIVERIRRFDGVYRWFQARGLPLRDSNEKIVRWYILLTDIDDLKRTEAALAASERNLKLTIDTIPALAWSAHPDGSAEFFNQLYLDFTGLSTEQASGWGWMIAVHPEDLNELAAAWQRILISEMAGEAEARLRRYDGRYRWFLFRISPLRDAAGAIVRWYGVNTDIEDRKRAEAELGALKDQLFKENLVLRDEVDRASMFEEIVGTSQALQPVLTRIAKVAPTDSTVLISGETGTGKELVARAIHRLSRRSTRAFVSVNCAAVPRELIASELFGHEKGAFTGAIQRRLGRFELAAQGTIFLDEVGELPAETQVALLRVLQEREFERVGGTARIQADVRVIAATNRNLEAEIAAGRFRSDLFYRLNVFPVEVPPLRDRTKDIPLLVEYFIDRYARKAGKSFERISTKSIQLLQSYPWPGNIRELQNVIERSVIVNETKTFAVDESWLLRQAQTGESPTTQPLFQQLASQEKEMIEAALRECGGRVSGPSGAAHRLGIPGSTLESKIKSLKINKNRFKP